MDAKAVEKALQEGVEKGWVKVREENGHKLYAITPEGEKHLQSVIKAA